MTLPMLAPVPPASVQKDLLPEEWEACMDSWLLLIQHYLLASTDVFASKVLKDSSPATFLVSYLKSTPSFPHRQAVQLRKAAFLLIHRIFIESRPPPSNLLEWTFWVDLCQVYNKSETLTRLLNGTWIQENMDQNKSMARYKSALVRALEVEHMNPELEELLEETLVLLRSCYTYGQFLMLGSDLMDSLSTSYIKKPRLRRKITTITYFSLVSLLELERQRVPTLLDHLYSLKSEVSVRESLIKDLVESTPLLLKLRSQVAQQDAGRAKVLVESLQRFEKTLDGRPRNPIRRKFDKGKGKKTVNSISRSFDGIDVHRLSLVSQIQDLFPDLGSGFIVKLLDEYHDDTEEITARLLDDSLPQSLNEADKSEAISQAHDYPDHDLVPDLAPRSTPPLMPVRRNVYDDDDFDRLAVDASKIRLGKDQSSTADDLLASQRPSSQKAAILSALAAFDSDDDERDDTYDAEDVGGTVDVTNDENAADLRVDVHEETLFNAYRMTPDVFNRNADTRRSKARADLKLETSMTDEAIEGWGIMLGREPKRLNGLSRKFEMGSRGQQRALDGTAWRADSGTEKSDAGGQIGRGRGSRARGSRGGRGGHVAGPADDKETQVARQRKDASKGSRANHDRRDQRARKVARGGFLG